MQRGRSERDEWRRQTDGILGRATRLAREDRALIEAVYRDGVGYSELAAILGVRPETARARVRALVRHLNSRRFLFILAHEREWCDERRQIATVRFLQRRTLRQTVEHTRLSMHRVRMHCQAIIAQQEAMGM